MKTAGVAYPYSGKLKEFTLLLGNPYYIVKNKYEMIRTKDRLNIPPMFLRQRVHGTRDIYGFMKVGKNCVEDLTHSLRKIGINWSDFPSILDFGCGCGRVLRFLAQYSRSSRFYGTDMDSEAIVWCVKNIHFGEFISCDPVPPLKYDSEKFDLIFGVSVFTHLNEDLQLAWLDELRRIMKKNAVLLITVEGSQMPEIGNYCGSSLSSEEISILTTKQIFSKQPKKTVYHAQYSSYTHTYQTKKYIYENWPKYLEIVDFISRGLNNHHDIVILTK